LSRKAEGKVLSSNLKPRRIRWKREQKTKDVEGFACF
jgi:hypothetical protein